MNNAKPDPNIRLQAKKQMLRRRAERSSARIQDNIDYARRNIVNVAGEQIVDVVESKNPFIAGILRVFLPSQRGNRLSYDTPRHRSHIPTGQSPLGFSLSSIGELILPFIYGVGQQKLLSFGLRGFGKLLRVILRFLFGRLFK